MSKRSEALADRLEQGALALIALAESLTSAEWQMRVQDGRRVGVVIHHVATMYPLEMKLALTLAAGSPVRDVTWDDVHRLNATHARDFDAVTKAEAIALLARNSIAAATAIRALIDDELDRAAPVSLNGDAPLTCQFMLEDHAVRHSFHHMAAIKRALKWDEVREAA
jgi:hypothetical protein